MNIKDDTILKTGDALWLNIFLHVHKLSATSLQPSTDVYIMSNPDITIISMMQFPKNILDAVLFSSKILGMIFHSKNVSRTCIQLATNHGFALSNIISDIYSFM